MDLIWSEALSVDIVSIDGQHRHLAECLTEFFGGLAGGMPVEVVDDHLAGLIKAVRDHFAHEERIMRNIGLPSLDRHREQHRRLLLDLDAYAVGVAEWLARGEGQAVEDHLTDWLIHHMMAEDRLILDHLHGRADCAAGEPPVLAWSEERATILIVDDMAQNIHVLAQILKDEYRVVFARSGAQALQVAAQTEPDIILLDVMMPDMDGFTVCAKLKANAALAHIPVIFVTAMGEVEDETMGLEAGAIDYLTKPANASIVRSRVRNHLELKRQRDLLRRIALVDGLTGIANRRHFDEVLDLEWRRAQRQQTSLSLILCDVDHFKGYNDLYGHQAGDDCLREVARHVAGGLSRSSDSAARYGGEEFVCVLPDTDQKGALAVAERIRAGLAARAMPHAASSAAAYVTLSLGVASVVPTAGAGQDSLLALADQQLYDAKNSGRDRACSAILHAC